MHSTGTGGRNAISLKMQNCINIESLIEVIQNQVGVHTPIHTPPHTPTHTKSQSTPYQQLSISFFHQRTQQNIDDYDLEMK